MILWTSCKQPIIGEVEFSIGFYGVVAVPQPRSGCEGYLIKLLVWRTLVLSNLYRLAAFIGYSARLLATGPIALPTQWIKESIIMIS